MSIFDVLTLLGGLALFLYGMNAMGMGLEKRAGSKLKTILGNMTSNPIKGFLLGLVVTCVIQSSSATTVMVVGFVNSGIMALNQAVGVIMGANLGTSVTSWILSLTGIEGDSFFVQILKPSSFTPILGMIGIIFYMFQKNPKRKDTGMIFLGFAILMFGMETMSDAVEGLKNVPEFTRILVLFSNPILGVIVGTVFTAVIQSSSASVGILQALTATGSVTHATAIPIIMGQNIGTCVSAMISSIGASKNARRAALIHLYFNILATLILLPLYYLANAIFDFAFVQEAASPFTVAVIHTVFKLLALAVLMPQTKLLEKLANMSIRENKKDDETSLLDERLMTTPSVAIGRCKEVTVTMAELAIDSVKRAFGLLTNFDAKVALAVQEEEGKVDVYEDKLGTYLVKLSTHSLTEADSAECSKLLHLIGDIERISDYAVNIVESAEEMTDKQLVFSADARKELNVLINAVNEILELSLISFKEDDLNSAVMVEPLEQVVDYLKDVLKKQHILRLQRQECTIEMGFILSDLLTTLERISDHCSNIAGCILEMSHEELDIHEYLKRVKGGEIGEFNDYFDYFKMKYAL